jgi:hypothetical protein
MAVAEHGQRVAGLRAPRDQERPAARRIRDEAAFAAERGQRRRDLVLEIALELAGAIRILALGADRDAARELGGETALVEEIGGAGDGGGAGHAGPMREVLDGHATLPASTSPRKPSTAAGGAARARLADGPGRRAQRAARPAQGAPATPSGLS